MRLGDERRSDNIEDRRGEGGGRGFGGGFGGGGGGALIQMLMMMLMRGGRGGAVIGLLLLGVLAWNFCRSDQPAEARSVTTDHQAKAADADLVEVVEKVLASTEDVWTAQFRAMGKTYVAPKLVLFTGEIKSACGFASAAVGPFYCPEDHKVYIDLSFYRTLKNRLGAPGDFAQAYVIAHEIGHHVQSLLGTLGRVHAQQRGLSEERANELSVRLELQADFYAGVWAHHADRMRQILEHGDIEEGLNAASKIGDDALQRRQTGHVRPESFTHGTSEQRVRWFKLGYETGDVSKGDTFAARRP